MEEGIFPDANSDPEADLGCVYIPAPSEYSDHDTTKTLPGASVATAPDVGRDDDHVGTCCHLYGSTKSLTLGLDNDATSDVSFGPYNVPPPGERRQRYFQDSSQLSLFTMPLALYSHRPQRSGWRTKSYTGDEDCFPTGRSWREALHMYSRRTTIHGLRHITEPQTLILRRY